MVQDVGRAVNPLTLRGQVIGSLVQGLGGALLEDLIYDEHGQFLTGSLADYLLPTATDFPNLRCVVLDDYPSPINPLGAKGAGEGGIIAAGGCMANAVANALQSFGVQPRELPLSPTYIWELVQAGQRRRRSIGIALVSRTERSEAHVTRDPVPWQKAGSRVALAGARCPGHEPLR